MDSEGTCHHIRSSLGISMSHRKNSPLSFRLLSILLTILIRPPNCKLPTSWTISNHIPLLPTTKTSSYHSITGHAPMPLTTSRTNYIPILRYLPSTLISTWSRLFLYIASMSTITLTPLPLLFLLMKLFRILLYNNGSIHHL